MGEKEVHGGVQSGVQPDESQNDSISQQGESVEQGEEATEKHLHPWAEWKSLQDELWDPCLVLCHNLAAVLAMVTAVGSEMCVISEAFLSFRSTFTKWLHFAKDPLLTVVPELVLFQKGDHICRKCTESRGDVKVRHQSLTFSSGFRRKTSHI